MHPSGLAGFLLFRGPFSEITRGWYALVGQWCWRRDVGANSFPAFVVQHGHEWELWALQDSTGQSNGPRVFFIILKVHSPLRSNGMRWMFLSYSGLPHYDCYSIALVQVLHWWRTWWSTCLSLPVWPLPSCLWRVSNGLTLKVEQLKDDLIETVPMVKVVPPRACCTPGNPDESFCSSHTYFHTWFFLGSRDSICFLLLSFAVILVIVTIVYCCFCCCRHCQCGTYFESWNTWSIFWRRSSLNFTQILSSTSKWSETTDHHWLYLMINMVRCSKWTCYHKYKNIDEYWIQLAGMKTGFSLETERACVWVLLCCYASLTKFIFVHGLFVSPGTLSYSRPYLSLCSGTQSVQ